MNHLVSVAYRSQPSKEYVFRQAVRSGKRLLKRSRSFSSPIRGVEDPRLVSRRADPIVQGDPAIGCDVTDLKSVIAQQVQIVSNPIDGIARFHAIVLENTDRRFRCLVGITG